MNRHLREFDGQLWFKEALVEDYGALMRVDEVLYDEDSDFQNLLVFENERFGRVLALDGIVQVALSDEYVYHEMATHPALFAVAEPKRVLVIGGGDGGIIREVFRHQSVEKATLVEIDGDVVEFSKKWFPQVSGGAFDDPRLDLKIEDGAKYVAETDDRFDVVIVDSTDPIGPGKVLFTEEFYRDCRRVLNTGGVLVTQNGLPVFQATELKTAHDRLSSVFAHSSFLVIAIASYCGGFMTLGFSTDDAAAFQPDEAAVKARYDAAGFATKYYTPELQRAAFALPAFIQHILRD
ncbi:MAG: polyamine aminopropyltransferase [Pseudomonadota bacterium]